MPCKREGNILIEIDWNEYKTHKQYSVKEDNFEVLLDFMKSYYNLIYPSDLFETLKEDELALMMLEKRKIYSAEDLVSYLHKA